MSHDATVLVERLAALEHDQWVEWSKSIAATEALSPERLARWKPLWCPYADLSDEMKEHDRVWARKTIAAIAGMVGDYGWTPLHNAVLGTNDGREAPDRAHRR